MTDTLIDCRFDALRALGFQGAVNDMLFEYWQVLGGLGNTLNDRWVSFLFSQGFTGRLNDTWFLYLGSLGYTGQLNDREKEYWCSLKDTLNDSGSILTEDGSFLVTETNEIIVQD